MIIGGGASGLFLGYLFKKNYLILEHNSEIGAKIKISGGGKCNITNKILSEKNYKGNNEFIKEVFKNFNNKDLLKWLKENNLEVKELKKNQYFLASSTVLLDFFKKNVKNIKTNIEVLDVKKSKYFIIKTNKGEIKAKKVVIASGGVSFKKLGASDIGFKIAKSFEHNILPLKPALVGFTVQKNESWFKNLSGISLKAELKINNKIFNQNILFSHKGITGPAILNASLWWERGFIEISFLRNIKSYLKNKNKQISTQLPLPKRFIKEFLKKVGLDDKKVRLLKDKDFEKLKLLEKYQFAPAGTFGFERAEVTKGGVDTNEVGVDMQSKKVNGLYFIGEVLDVTGELGGYNFQWAFSSAFNLFLRL